MSHAGEDHRVGGKFSPINAKDLIGIAPGIWITASDTIQAQADEEQTLTADTDLAEFQVYRTGVLKVKFDAKSSDTINFDPRVIVSLNDADTETDIDWSSYTTTTVTLSVVAGDTISLTADQFNGETLYVKNIRICFNVNTSSVDIE